MPLQAIAQQWMTAIPAWSTLVPDVATLTVVAALLFCCTALWIQGRTQQRLRRELARVAGELRAFSEASVSLGKHLSGLQSHEPLRTGNRHSERERQHQYHQDRERSRAELNHGDRKAPRLVPQPTSTARDPGSQRIVALREDALGAAGLEADDVAAAYDVSRTEANLILALQRRRR